MQSNDKAISIKIAGPESVSKWHSRRQKTNDTTVDKTESQPKSQPKSQTNLDNNSKTTPNKTVVKNDKKTNNNSNINNKRTKGPFVSQLHNQIKARFNLNASASKSISSLRPTHVFASTTSPHCSHKRENEPKLADGVSQPRDHCQLHHSFISDITDVRQMENTLLQLLDDFHSGKLQAFGQDITFEKMESVREQQERLARLHFDLNLQQEVYGHQTEEGKRMAKDNMSKLIENLQQLSNSIEQLQSRSSTNTGS